MSAVHFPKPSDRFSPFFYLPTRWPLSRPCPASSLPIPPTRAVSRASAKTLAPPRPDGRPAAAAPAGSGGGGSAGGSPDRRRAGSTAVRRGGRGGGAPAGGLQPRLAL